MIEKGLLPDFSDEALAELNGMQTPAAIDDEKVHYLRDILWASIDNDDTRDIDQLTAAQTMPGDAISILVAVADVDAMVRNGLAIDDHAQRNTTSVYTAAGAYTHSTAPNRRYVYLIIQRLLKAAVGGTTVPYGGDELRALAINSTEKENAANKVERQVFKSAAAILLESRIGEEFNAIVTGAAPKGTWARLTQQPVEGKLVEGFHGLDVGHRIHVQRIHTEVESGFIDFKKPG